MLALAALIVGAAASLEAKHLADCQIQYNDYFNERARAITEAAEQERNAERKFDEAQANVFLDPAVLKTADQRTPEEVKRLRDKSLLWFEATREQARERQKADEARAQHPIPEPPSEQCS